jgi:cbb3-type cytochrome c oxidase subunit III
MVHDGEQLFKTEGNCWACHGEDATGARGVGANLTDDEWWHGDGSYEAIFHTIRNGVPSDRARNAYGAMMPPGGGSLLGDEQLRAVAAYVWSRRRESTGP